MVSSTAIALLSTLSSFCPLHSFFIFLIHLFFVLAKMWVRSPLPLPHSHPLPVPLRLPISRCGSSFPVVFVLLLLFSCVSDANADQVTYNIGVLTNVLPGDAMNGVFIASRMMNMAQLAMYEINNPGQLQPNPPPAVLAPNQHINVLPNLAPGIEAVPAASVTLINQLIGGTEVCTGDHEYGFGSDGAIRSICSPSGVSSPLSPSIGHIAADSTGNFIPLMASITSAFNVPFITAGTEGDTLSDKSLYPTVARTCDCYADNSISVLNALLSLGLKQYAIIYTAKDFAVEVLDSFISAVDAYNANPDVWGPIQLTPDAERELSQTKTIAEILAAQQGLTPTDQLVVGQFPTSAYPLFDELMATFETILSDPRGFRVIVFTNDRDLIPPMLEAAQQYGLLQNRNYLFVTYTLQSGWSLYFTPQQQQLMAGFLGVSTVQLTNQATYDLNIRLYENAKRVYGNESLVALTIGPLPGVVNPYEVAVSPIESQVYDAVYLFAHAIANLTANSPNNNATFNGTQLYQAMIQADFMGANGRVKLKPNGDRIVTFGIYNVDTLGNLNLRGTTNNLAADGVTNDPRFVPIAYDPVAGTSPTFTWGDGSTSAQFVPLDRPELVVRTLSSSLTNAFIAISSFFLLVCLLLHVFIFKYRREPTIRSSNVTFQHLIIFGCSLTFISVILMSVNFNNSCSTFPLLLELGFDFTVASLFLRAWQIDRIFNATKLQVQPYKLELIVLMCITFIITIVGHVSWNEIDAPVPLYYIDPTNSFQMVQLCTSINYTSVWYAVFLTPKAILLASAMVIAFRIRNVAENFNESKYLALSIYQISLYAALTFILRSILGAEITGVFAITATFVVLSALGVLVLTFMRKLWNVTMPRYSRSDVTMVRTGATGAGNSAGNSTMGSGAGGKYHTERGLLESQPGPRSQPGAVNVSLPGAPASNSAGSSAVAVKGSRVVRAGSSVGSIGKGLVELSPSLPAGQGLETRLSTQRSSGMKTVNGRNGARSPSGDEIGEEEECGPDEMATLVTVTAKLVHKSEEGQME